MELIIQSFIFDEFVSSVMLLAQEVYFQPSLHFRAESMSLSEPMCLPVHTERSSQDNHAANRRRTADAGTFLSLLSLVDPSSCFDLFKSHVLFSSLLPVTVTKMAVSGANLHNVFMLLTLEPHLARNPYLVLHVRRNHLVSDTLREITMYSDVDLKKPLKVRDRCHWSSSCCHLD